MFVLFTKVLCRVCQGGAVRQAINDCVRQCGGAEQGRRGIQGLMGLEAGVKYPAKRNMARLEEDDDAGRT